MLISLLLGAGNAASAYPERLRASEIDRGPSAVQQAAAPTHPVTLQGGEDAVFTAQIAAGSAYDPIGREGTAWRAAVGLTRGGAGARNAAEARAALAASGGRWTVDVQRQWVRVRLTCPPDQASVCGALFADALTAPRFEPEVLRALADEARAELSAGADLDRLADELFVVALYEGHAYGHPVVGRAGVLDVVSPADVARFHRQNYVRQTVRVEVSGPVPDEDVRALDERLLGLPSTLPPDLALYAPPRRTAGARIVADVPEATRGVVRIGAPLRLAWTDPDGPALWLAIAALRAELGLPWPPTDPVAARELEDLVVPAGAEQFDAAWSTVERWAREGVAPDRFEVTQAALLAAPALAVERERLAALTVADVNAAIARHVDPRALSVVGVGAAPVEGARHVPLAGVFR